MMHSILLQAGPEGGGMSSVLMFGMVLLVMYFFFFRPQMKKQKEEGRFQDDLGKGMRVVTNSGIHGKILEVQEKQLVIESENSRLRIDRTAVSKELSAQYQSSTSDKKAKKDKEKQD